MTLLDPPAFAIQAAIDAITLAIQTNCPAIHACGLGAVRPPIEATIDSITLLIQPVLDAVSAIVDAVGNPVACIICPDGAADDQQNDCCSYCLPDVHNPSPLYPYN